jgi:hypothetical protein
VHSFLHAAGPGLAKHFARELTALLALPVVDNEATEFTSSAASGWAGSRAGSALWTGAALLENHVACLGW